MKGQQAREPDAGTDGAGYCGHRGCASSARDRLLTLPTGVTAFRTLLSLVFASLALSRGSETWLFASLAAYWIGDLLDGALARWTDTETRAGAVVDILSDRLGAGAFYIFYAVLHPEMVVPISIFLLQFALVDNYLSLSFQDWMLKSPNYFYLVDRRVWALNWSPVAKATNSGAFLILMVATGSPLLATLLACAVLVVKSYSLGLVVRLPRPVRTGCAVVRDAGPTP